MTLGLTACIHFVAANHFNTLSSNCSVAVLPSEAPLTKMLQSMPVLCLNVQQQSSCMMLRHSRLHWAHDRQTDRQTAHRDTHYGQTRFTFFLHIFTGDNWDCLMRDVSGCSGSGHFAIVFLDGVTVTASIIR